MSNDLIEVKAPELIKADSVVVSPLGDLVQNVYIAVDIEKTGAMFKYPINSIGFVVGDSLGNIIHKRKFNIQVEWPTIVDNKVISYNDFEPRCWDEFWSKVNKKVIDAVCNDPKPASAEVVWGEVAKFLYELELQYPSNKYELIFISDALDFDLANINYALELYACRMPIRYPSIGAGFRDAYCTTSMLTMTTTEVARKCKHVVVDKHDALDDAVGHYMTFINLSMLNKIG
jgi:hypothetical protein